MSACNSNPEVCLEFVGGIQLSLVGLSACAYDVYLSTARTVDAENSPLPPSIGDVLSHAYVFRLLLDSLLCAGMKLKDYLNSLVTRRKSNPGAKPARFKSAAESVSAADCHYEICDSTDARKCPANDQHNRTEVLLNRHAQLVNTIVGFQSQTNACTHCRAGSSAFLSLGHYSNTLDTCHVRQDHPYQTFASSSNNSLCAKTRQRSKIRTNPWLKPAQPSSSSKHFPHHSSTVPSGLIHSESFPQTICNANTRSTNPSHGVLHQSDSGQGFSLSSSRIVDSSSPDDTSNDGLRLDDPHTEQYSSPTTMPADPQRRSKKAVQTRYQHPSNVRVSRQQTRNSSPRLFNDHFSIQFEEIVENERLHQYRSPTRQSPFILPLDDTCGKGTPSTVTLRSSTLNKSDSRSILKHIEEIENEIQLIANLNIEQDEQMLASNDSSKEVNRRSIHEQVDEWIEQCLTTPNANPPAILPHTEGEKPPTKPTEMMTAFYLSATSPPRRSNSFISQPMQLCEPKAVHECPF